MKKVKRILAFIALAFTASLAFSADMNSDAMKSIVSFLNEGHYMLLNTKSEAIFYPRTSLAQISLNGDMITYFWLDSGNDYEVGQLEQLRKHGKFSLKYRTIRVDEKKNLIIEEK